MESALSIIFLNVNYRFSGLHLSMCNHKNKTTHSNEAGFFLMPVNGGFIPVGNCHGFWC